MKIGIQKWSVFKQFSLFEKINNNIWFRFRFHMKFVLFFYHVNINI